MTTFGVDYAFGRPGIAALKASGAKFVCRYLSHSPTKNLTSAEAHALSNAGIWIVVVWETTAKRSLDGRTAGVADAIDAQMQAQACGMPSGRPIYFAVDWDATSAQQSKIDAYLDGAASVLGKARVGIYGGYGPVSRAMSGGHAAWGWQTYAWSGGRWYGPAQLQQYSNGHPVGGVDSDYDRATQDDYGQWRIGATPTPTPMEEDMPYGGQLPAGAGARANVSFPKGSMKAIGLVYDSPDVAEVRVAFHHKGGSGEVYTLKVGGPRTATDTWPAKTVQTFKTPADGDWVSLTRLDSGTSPVGWDMS